MKLNIDPEALAFIKEEGGQAVILAGRAGGCCGAGWAVEPHVELGEPRRPASEYQPLQVDGATLYLDRRLERVEATYRLHLTKLFRWRSLGIAYESGSRS
ncbi:MAG: CC/Se motif family (seleno)protein [Bacillota bacterium]